MKTRTPRGKDRPAEAKPFLVRFVAGKGWQVKQGENWRSGVVSINGMLLITTASGDLAGEGVIDRRGDTIRVTA